MDLLADGEFQSKIDADNTSFTDQRGEIVLVNHTQEVEYVLVPHTLLCSLGL